MGAAKTYALDVFVEDLRSVVASARSQERLLMRLRPFVRRFALSKSWLLPRHYETEPDQGNGVHLLHEEPDHSLAVAAVTWLPGHETPPHDHGTWAVVAAVEGPEANTFWRRLDDRTRAGYAELERIDAKVLSIGDVIAMPEDAIHSVANETKDTTMTLHVYGRNLQYSERFEFDIEQRLASPRRTVWRSA